VVIQDLVDAVVDQLAAAVLEHLACHLAGGVPHAFRLGAGGLQPPQLLEHLVQQHHDVTPREQPVEGVGVFDEGRGVRNVDRARKRVGGRLHVECQSTIES
jgi:hypothetical protein